MSKRPSSTPGPARLEDLPVTTSDGRPRFPGGVNLADALTAAAKIVATEAIDATGAPCRGVLASTPQAKGRPVPHRMNKTERRYAERLSYDPHVLAWWYEEITFTMGPDLRYTADFFVLLDTLALEVHEVKGPYERDDARPKFRMATGRYPFVFRYCILKDGTWTITTPYTEDRTP